MHGDRIIQIDFGGHARAQLRVRLEPAIEPLMSGRSPEEIEALADLYFRWAKQMYLKAGILRQELRMPPRPPAPRTGAFPRASTPRARARAHGTPELPWPELLPQPPQPPKPAN